MPNDNGITELPPDPYDEPELPEPATTAPEHAGGAHDDYGPEFDPEPEIQEEVPKSTGISKKNLYLMFGVGGALFLVMFIFVFTKKDQENAAAQVPLVPTLNASGLSAQKPSPEDYQQRFPTTPVPAVTSLPPTYSTNGNYKTYASSDAPAPKDNSKPAVLPVQSAPSGFQWKPADGGGAAAAADSRPLGFFFSDFRVVADVVSLSSATGPGADLVKAAEIQTQTDYQKQNGQTQKENFLRTQQADYANYSTAAWSAPIDPRRELKASYLIPAVLLTEVNTDNPGSVTAQVTQDVYDSYSGANLLIPRGSRVIGRYNSAVSFQQNRVQIAWERLIRTDFVTISLIDSAAVDSAGASGVSGAVDSHYGDIAAGVTASSAFDLGVNATTAYIAGLPGMGALAGTLQGKQGVAEQLSTQIITRVLNRQPTITVAPGTILNVQIMKDIILPIVGVDN